MQKKLDLFKLQEQLYNAHNWIVAARISELHRSRNIKLACQEIEDIVDHIGHGEWSKNGN